MRMYRRKRVTLLLLLSLAVLTAFWYTRKPTAAARGQKLAKSAPLPCETRLSVEAPRIIFGRGHRVTCENKCSRESAAASAAGQAELTQCVNHESYQFCRIKIVEKRPIVSCEYDARCKKGFSLGITSDDWRNIEWEEFSSHSSLRLYLSSLIDTTNPRHHQGFVVIRCQLHDKTDRFHENIFISDSYARGRSSLEGVQLLPLPPKLSHLPQHLVKRSNSAEKNPPAPAPAPGSPAGQSVRTSVGLILTGGSSRRDFYRLFPRTLASLTNLNTRHNSNTEILDYSLLQSLGSDNNTNIQALLSGYVPSLSSKSEESHTDTLFGYYSARGYHTLLLDMTCSHVESLVGIAVNSTVHRELLQEHLSLAGIDSLGLTLSSCLTHQPLTSGQPCHTALKLEKYLEYLNYYRQLLDEHKIPHISILLTGDLPANKEVDTVLNAFIGKGKNFKDSITILSSIKNRGGEEPLPLFLIMPQKTKERMEDLEWQNLVMNQDRLVSMLDIHQTLRSLVRRVASEVHGEQQVVDGGQLAQFKQKFGGSGKGVFAEIKETRGCGELPRTEFGCVCSPEIREESPPSPRSAMLGEFGFTYWRERGAGSQCEVEAVVITSVKSFYHGEEDQFSKLEIQEEIFGTGNTDSFAFTVALLINLDSGKMRVDYVLESRKSLCTSQGDKQGEPAHSALLAFIEEKKRDASVKTVDALYAEEGLDCFFLLETSRHGVAVIDLVNTCINTVKLEVEFRTEASCYFLEEGTITENVEPNSKLPVNMYLVREGSLLENPVWEYIVKNIDSV